MTVRDLANGLLDMPLWGFLIWLPFACFSWFFAIRAAKDFYQLVKSELYRRRPPS